MRASFSFTVVLTCFCVAYFAEEATGQDTAENASCTTDHFRCNSGKCIPVTWVCDGFSDCEEREDEDQSCEDTTCSPEMFRCNDRRCIPQEWVCDHDSDCLDGEDEPQSCLEDKEYTCTKKQRECGLSSPFNTYLEFDEDLQKECERLQEKVSCTVDARDTCDIDDDDFISKQVYYRELSSYLASTCQEENPTFNTISSNMGCIIRLFLPLNSTLCIHNFSQKSWDSLSNVMNPYYEESRRHLIPCIWYVIERTCQYEKIQHRCGAQARDAFEEFISKVDLVSGECNTEKLEEIKPFCETYDEILAEEMKLENAVDEEER